MAVRSVTMARLRAAAICPTPFRATPSSGASRQPSASPSSASTVSRSGPVTERAASRPRSASVTAPARPVPTTTRVVDVRRMSAIAVTDWARTDSVAPTLGSWTSTVGKATRKAGQTVSAPWGS